MEKYRQRVADAVLSKKLESMGAVLVEGPKWCGKTTTCKQFAKSILDLSDPDVRDRSERLAEIGIKTLLEGDEPRLIDEWQVIPKFWDAIRHHVDHSEGHGHFLLTGSAVVPEKKRDEIKHTGTGRISRMKMRPMSLWESGESSGSVCLKELFAGKTLNVVRCSDRNLDEVAYIVW